LAPSTPFSGPASYSSANVPLKPPASITRTDRWTSFLSPQRSQYFACTFDDEYGASALRPLKSMYSCSQLQKSGVASQYGWLMVSMMIRRFIGSAARPQWFSKVTLIPRLPPKSAISLYDSIAAFMSATISRFRG